jgi:hypothetical protein
VAAHELPCELSDFARLRYIKIEEVRSFARTAMFIGSEMSIEESS